VFVISNPATGAVIEAAQFAVTAPASNALPMLPLGLVAAALIVDFLWFVAARRRKHREEGKSPVGGIKEKIDVPVPAREESGASRILPS
jgi:uncharacterized membrane protein